jgi:hypothetical protein
LSKVVLNRAEVLSTPQRFMLPIVQRTTRQIHVAAKRMAPRGDHMKGSGKRQPGQPLQPSINAKVNVGVNRISGIVGSRKEYATTVHDGSKPHIIRSKGKMLKFKSDRLDFLVAARAGRRGGNKRRGGFHYAFSVRHPGNKRPVRYLTTPLVLYGRANGFLVIKSLSSTLHGQIQRLP